MSSIVLISNFQTVKGWLLPYLLQKNIKRIAFIVDAKTPRVAINPEYVFIDKLAFESAGIDVCMVKLEEVIDIDETIASCDAIYVKGGNSFYLLNAINNSGFTKTVIQALVAGKLYIGESAGAYVACPSIEMAHWKHQDKDIVGLTDLAGMGIVPFLVSAHYEDDLENSFIPHIKQSKYDVELLRENEALIYEDNTLSRVKVESQLRNASTSVSQAMINKVRTVK